MLKELEKELATLNAGQHNHATGREREAYELVEEALRHLARTNPRASWRGSETTELMLRMCALLARVTNDARKGKGLRTALHLPHRVAKSISPLTRPYKDMK